MSPTLMIFGGVLLVGFGFLLACLLDAARTDAAEHDGAERDAYSDDLLAAYQHGFQMGRDRERRLQFPPAPSPEREVTAWGPNATQRNQQNQ